MGVSYNADGGDKDYYDFSDELKTSFYQGNMKVSFLNEQAALYLGKFDDFNADFIADGYALGGQYVTNLADKDYGPYLTGLMISPIPVSGLRLFVGFPILPQNGNGIPNADYSKWSNLGKKIKLAASYQLPDDKATINAGFRPGTYFDGVDAAGTGTYAKLTEDFTKSQFGEGYLQVLMPNLTDGVNANFTYDIRYRDAEYKTVRGTTKEHTSLAHMVGLSAEFGSLVKEGLMLAVEDRFFFANDDYIQSDEKFMYDIFAVAAEMPIDGQLFNIGLNLAGMFGSDANGTALSNNGDVSTGNYYCNDDIGMSINDMATAKTSNLKGVATKYIGVYANPYVKFNMSNGALTIGAELLYTSFKNDNVTNTGFNYRIPVGLKFDF